MRTARRCRCWSRGPTRCPVWRSGRRRRCRRCSRDRRAGRGGRSRRGRCPRRRSVESWLPGLARRSRRCAGRRRGCGARSCRHRRRAVLLTRIWPGALPGWLPGWPWPWLALALALATGLDRMSRAVRTTPAARKRRADPADLADLAMRRADPSAGLARAPGWPEPPADPDEPGWPARLTRLVGRHAPPGGRPPAAPTAHVPRRAGAGGLGPASRKASAARSSASAAACRSCWLSVRAALSSASAASATARAAAGCDAAPAWAACRSSSARAEASSGVSSSVLSAELLEVPGGLLGLAVRVGLLVAGRRLRRRARQLRQGRRPARMPGDRSCARAAPGPIRSVPASPRGRRPAREAGARAREAGVRAPLGAGRGSRHSPRRPRRATSSIRSATRSAASRAARRCWRRSSCGFGHATRRRVIAIPAPATISGRRASRGRNAEPQVDLVQPCRGHRRAAAPRADPRPRGRQARAPCRGADACRAPRPRGARPRRATDAATPCRRRARRPARRRRRRLDPRGDLQREGAGQAAGWPPRRAQPRRGPAVRSARHGATTAADAGGAAGRWRRGRGGARPPSLTVRSRHGSASPRSYDRRPHRAATPMPAAASVRRDGAAGDAGMPSACRRARRAASTANVSSAARIDEA